MKAYQVVGMELFIGCMKSITKDTRTGGKTLMVDFNAASAANKAVSRNKFVQDYKLKVPRFKVEGMNQAEFITHIFVLGFMSGSRWQKERNNNGD